MTSSQFSHVHAMQGGDFWIHCSCGGSEEAERRTAIVRIYPTTATYIVPDQTVDWYGIASTGSHIYLVGRDSSNKGVIISMTP